MRTSLQGRRVDLQLLDHGHAAGLFAAASDPDVWRYMPIRGFDSLEAVDDWIATALAARDAGREEPFAIVDRKTGTAIGSTRFLDIRPDERALEIGWTWLAYDRHRAGYNVEMKYLLLRHAFEERDALRVAFFADARNEKSRTALRSIGAVYEGTLRRHRARERNGYERDSAAYSILAHEWPAVKSRLEAMLAR